jgi:hypothetical protein
MDVLPAITLELDQLNLSKLSQIFDGRAFLRGRSLASYNKVSTPRAAHNQLSARVYDNTSRPFKVTVTVSSEGVQTSCGCQGGERCAHAAAVLVLWVQRRQAFLFTPLDKRTVPLPFPKASTIWQGRPNEEHAASLLLSTQRISELRKIAQLVGIEDKGQSKEDLAWEIAPLLGEPRKLEPLLLGLSEPEEAVLQILALYDGDIGPLDIGEILTALGYKTPQIAAALKSLQSRGLALSRKPSQPNAPLWSIPNEILPHLPHGRLPLAQAWAATEEPQAPQQDILVSMRAFCFQLTKGQLSLQEEPQRSEFETSYPAFAGWFNKGEEVDYISQLNRGLLVNQHVALTMLEPPLGVDIKELEQIAAELQLSFDQLSLIVRLLKQLQLLEEVDQRLQVTERMDEFWQRSRSDQLCLLVTTWANDLLWSELHRLPNIELRRNLQATFSATIEQLYAEWATLRRTAVRLIRHFKPGQAYDLADFYQRIQPFAAQLFRKQIERLYGQLWIFMYRKKRSVKLEKPESWETIFLPYLQQVIAQLELFGVVQIAHGGASVRLTSLGAELYAIEAPSPALPAQLDLTIDSDFRIRLPISQATSTILSELEQFSELIDLSQAQFHYQITPASFRKALANGLSSQTIVSCLEQYSKRALPKKLTKTMNMWASSYGQSQFYPDLALLELADELVLTELLRQTRLSSVMLDQLTPRLLVIDPTHLAAFWDELVAKGYTPYRAKLVGGSAKPQH